MPPESNAPSLKDIVIYRECDAAAPGCVDITDIDVVTDAELDGSAYSIWSITRGGEPVVDWPQALPGRGADQIVVTIAFCPPSLDDHPRTFEIPGRLVIQSNAENVGYPGATFDVHLKGYRGWP